MFFYFLFFNIIKVNQFFIILLHLISCFSFSRSFLVPHAHVTIESIDCIFLSSSEIKAILLISSVKALYLSRLNLYCDCNINLLFFYDFFMFLLQQKKISMSMLFFFLDGLFYPQVELLLKRFYNFQT